MIYLLDHSQPEATRGDMEDNTRFVDPPRAARARVKDEGF
jgi:hypothetical protein